LRTLCMASALGVVWSTMYLPWYGARWNGCDESLQPHVADINIDAAHQTLQGDI